MPEDPRVVDHASSSGASSSGAPPSIAAARLDTSEVRWRCDPASLPFETTADIEPAAGVVGQDSAVDALYFGLESTAQGQNVFVRGLTGTGRMTLIRQLLETIQLECPLAPDRCYVYNFRQHDRPILITLPRGTARAFSRMVDEFVDFVRDDLARTLATSAIKTRQAAMEQAANEEIRSLVEPFDRDLREANLTFVSIDAGPLSQAAIFPLIDGKPVSPEEFESLRAAGTITDEQIARMNEDQEKFRERFDEVTRAILEKRLAHTEAMRDFVRGEARKLLGEFTRRIQMKFPQEAIATHLKEMVDDIVDTRLAARPDEPDSLRRYRVNIVNGQETDNGCPIIVEQTPTLVNLLGSIDREVGPGGIPRSDHMMIHSGSLLRADGGYLILEARDVLSEPGAWKVLVRTLRNGCLEIVPPELTLPWGGQSMKPAPIDIDIKVVLLGDSDTYAVLDNLDPDFPNLFKVLADFDSVIPRDETGIVHYSSVIARVTKTDNLLPFDRSAVAALVEHGARIASRRGKLTARFSRLADLMREAHFIANKAGRPRATGDDVREAVRRTKHRANLPSRRFHELLADGTIRVQTRGTTVGQINGLAVIRAGQIGYGFPARITATIGAGSAGVMNIEGEANLSGAIHTKGFYILSGLLRFLLQTDHPLAFDASIAFEQSYGGIDGDSASGAEICCLISALTNVPIRQDLAMTGAIDQLGHILAIGGVNEKIEGFYETCRDVGLTGTQGVIIPRANAGDLMLRPEVVEAHAKGEFHVYAVDTVHDALEILTGVDAGRREGSADYAESSILGRAVARARAFWIKASMAPRGQRPTIEKRYEPAPSDMPEIPGAGPDT